MLSFGLTFQPLVDCQAERYDWLSPAILRFLSRVANQVATLAQETGHKVDLAVCGEMGGRQLEALALLGLGIRRFSITPAAVGPIKALMSKIDLPEIESAMSGWLASPPPDLRAELIHWAQRRNIALD